MPRLELEPNREPPEVMHIDLNSAFAMTEQQANPLLRGKPVGVTNRLSDYSICIAASYEAKKVGIGLGTRRPEALLKDRRFVMLESDPAKYGYVHKTLEAIFKSYSPTAYMKSVDEGIIDFRGMRRILKGRTLENIGTEIKQRVRDEVGEYMKVNVGIAQNRYLAKVAAGFLKPDGLYTIDRQNLEVVYSLLDLTDLPYIKARNKQRLYDAGIYTTLDFYHAPEPVLTKQVFKSIDGHHWYLKLRGYETEVPWGVRTVGRSYVLEHRTSDPTELATLFHKSSVKLARRLARFDFAARGLLLNLHYASQPLSLHGEVAYPYRRWFGRHMYKSAVRRGDQIYGRIMELFAASPPGMVVSGLAMTAYALEPVKKAQPSLFEDDYQRRERLEDAINNINDRYGELVVQPASVKKSKNPMKDKVPFGSIRYFD
jgi:DNA polymerase IV